MKITRHLIITGRVQGVYYRESMRIEADRLGVTGWVRNRRDGAVEAMVHGDPEWVEALIQWAWQGPPAAQVASIVITEHSDEFARFERLPSA